MNKIIKYFSVLFSIVFIFISTASIAVESKDPIKLTLHDWTGQLITTNIMAEVLKKMNGIYINVIQKYLKV